MPSVGWLTRWGQPGRSSTQTKGVGLQRPTRVASVLRNAGAIRAKIAKSTAKAASATLAEPALAPLRAGGRSDWGSPATLSGVVRGSAVSDGLRWLRRGGRADQRLEGGRGVE